MAKSTGYTFFWALLLGLIGASLFWLYSPFLRQEVTRQVEDTLQRQEMAAAAGEKGSDPGKAATSRVAGSRFQLLAEGGKTFLADHKEGRVWRYFKHSREEGWARDEEGFVPLPIHFGGKTYISASDILAAEKDAKTP